MSRRSGINSRKSFARSPILARLVRAVVVAIAASLGLWAYGSADDVNARLDASDGGARGAYLNGYTLEGRVVRVADGDTFTLLVGTDQKRVRMASIDAPEVGKDRERPGQPFAQASKDGLARLIAGKQLRLSCYERDHYGRDVCDVLLDDGDTANRKQVAAGLAWANMEGKGKFMRDPALPALEQQARRARLGVWRDDNPVQPWAWRYTCWRQRQC